jgi:hypothetical protein
MVSQNPSILHFYKIFYTLWVRRVSDDNIELVLMVSHELKTIADEQIHLRVVEALGHVWQVELGNLDDVLVDLTLGHMLNQRVLGYFTRDTPITSTNDEHTLWIWVAVEGKEGNHFLI